MPSRFPPRSVLLATDLGEPSLRAMELGGSLARIFGARTTVLHAQAVETPPYFGEAEFDALFEHMRKARHEAEIVVRRDAERLVGPDAKVVVTEGPPVAAILRTAEAVDADLVALGTHGRTGAARAWLGSVAENVIRLATVPVLVVRASVEPRPWKTILCPVGEGLVASRALEWAVALAESAKARLVAVHAHEKPGLPPVSCPEVTDGMRARAEIEEVVEPGSPGALVARVAAERAADLVVMGTNRRRGLLGGLGSSTTARVVRSAAAPVLVIPVVVAEDLPL